VTGSTDLLDLIAGRVTDVDTAWSVGTFGAVAEFTRDAEETAALDRGADAISVVTARGGMRIGAHDAVRAQLPPSRSPSKAGISVWHCAYPREPAP